MQSRLGGPKQPGRTGSRYHLPNREGRNSTRIWKSSLGCDQLRRLHGGKDGRRLGRRFCHSEGGEEIVSSGGCECRSKCQRWYRIRDGGQKQEWGGGVDACGSSGLPFDITLETEWSIQGTNTPLQGMTRRGLIRSKLQVDDVGARRSSLGARVKDQTERVKVEGTWVQVIPKGGYGDIHCIGNRGGVRKGVN
jgi:hypothetical protein